MKCKKCTKTDRLGALLVRFWCISGGSGAPKVCGVHSTMLKTGAVVRPLGAVAGGLKALKNKAFSPTAPTAPAAPILLRKCQIRVCITEYIRYIVVFKCFWKNGGAVGAVVHFVPH